MSVQVLLVPLLSVGTVLRLKRMRCQCSNDLRHAANKYTPLSIPTLTCPPPSQTAHTVA